MSLADEWVRAGQKTAAAAVVIAGSVHEVQPWAELMTQLEPSAGVSTMYPRAVTNLLHFRGNYSRLCALWLLIMAVRHPISSICLALVLVGWFHALLVRRGVVHLSAPRGIKVLEGRQVTLMGTQLLAALSVASLLALIAMRCLWFSIGLLVTPVGVCVLHAALRRPAVAGGSGELVMELRHQLQRSLHVKQADSDQMEQGSTDLPPPVRDAEMAKRVQEIRQKYRPPTSKIAQD
mmetsp:Transcript_60895/g.135683  ORF Transcript_60895/g.135683 Transcript_60895/m.135683 type:complete len:235 (-) Transcript_60895:160-864(-)